MSFCSGSVSGQSVRCPEIRVSQADYANCNGVFSLTNTSVSWAPDRPVYKHQSRNRSDPDLR